jgi:alkanesulfonate monooxygenase SsuD/methylene tetrahydromethanopterin reductase-like flavin-dependent oxidoreductase (luciferase family)
MVSASQRGLDFMARHGIKGVIGGGAAPGGAGEEVVKRWQETLARHGKETELGGDLAIGINFHIAETEQKAIENVRDIFHENMKMFAPLIGHDLTDDQVGILGDPRRAPHAGLPTVEDAIRGGSWIVGPPELVTEKLMDLQDRWPGLERIHVNVTPMGTPLSMTLEQLERFGAEVMPTFKKQGTNVPVPAD